MYTGDYFKEEDYSDGLGSVLNVHVLHGELSGNLFEHDLRQVRLFDAMYDLREALLYDYEKLSVKEVRKLVSLILKRKRSLYYKTRCK